jgi:hypothetical protein
MILILGARHEQAGVRQWIKESQGDRGVRIEWHASE